MSRTPNPEHRDGLRPEQVGADERRRVEHNLDRIEDRLRDAPEGLHRFGSPADPDALRQSPLPPAAQLLWAQWDGLELAAGALTLWPLAEIVTATAELRAAGSVAADDVPIGERDGELLVICADPHAEGADVVLVEEDGERLPHSASVDLLVLAMLGEVAVLYDEEGEYQEQLFGSDGELTRAAERRLLRRHLDLDPDAPLARFRLAQSLRRAGELRAAAGELRQLLRRAPEFAWGHHEHGRVLLGLGGPQGPGDALRAFTRAAELAREPGLQAHFLAWACVAAEPGSTVPASKDRSKHGDRGERATPTRADLAARVLACSPEFVRAQESALREALEREDLVRAEEALRLGLAVVPGQLGLLSLRPALEALRARPPEPAEGDDDDPLADETDREIRAAWAAAEADDDLTDRDATPDSRRRITRVDGERSAAASSGKPPRGQAKSSSQRAAGGARSSAKPAGARSDPRAPARSGSAVPGTAGRPAKRRS
ncbi:MAG: hypothetical protein IPO88_17650 [Nannocystis sp.]|uniref:hypothetical protein n=1 Tax=Nannocystis sp. TaxID=1962667 RepID=UPI002424214B|nr:hypothetical protein [Nannocystis sp.]MBK9755291.1 hypothetical protein [Nannocystis sp.]